MSENVEEIMQEPEQISNLDTRSVKEYVDELEKDQDTDAWKKLLDLLNGYDDKTLKDWQDELANLLTFTGLFSAVVTGFVTYSLPKLEEDFAQTSSNILRATALGGGRISADDPIMKEFHPDHRIVHVNVLWMVSLTLSLMAAFFTIAVQQWLRHIPLPSQLTVREAVRLRQLRYNGILAWNVPTVVSLLPTLVQHQQKYSGIGCPYNSLTRVTIQYHPHNACPQLPSSYLLLVDRSQRVPFLTLHGSKSVARELLHVVLSVTCELRGRYELHRSQFAVHIVIRQLLR